MSWIAGSIGFSEEMFIILKVLQGTFNWLGNSHDLIPKPLRDLHKPTRHQQEDIVIILVLNACHRIGFQLIRVRKVIKRKLFF